MFRLSASWDALLIGSLHVQLASDGPLLECFKNIIWVVEDEMKTHLGIEKRVNQESSLEKLVQEIGLNSKIHSWRKKYVYFPKT